MTIGTPNLGAIKDDIYWDEAFEAYISIDEKSEAARDLAYQYDFNNSNNPETPGVPAESDNGIFLFGGDENSIPGSRNRSKTL